ncbi:MAG: PilT/PilU family type 4a pilus ATPase [Planctomycetes bacterium]|nr:PilT/PilU family type 4a pilus ATPase [Planctomycetota bacterium]
MDTDRLLRFAVEQGASDLHIQSGAAPMLRLGGKMRSVEGNAWSCEQVMEFLGGLVHDRLATDLSQAAMSGLDFAFDLREVARFRCSAFSSRGKAGVVMRVIRTKIPSIDELRLPRVVQDIALSGRGLTLVAGATGSGKSTTLAAMIDLLNDSRREKIITIEDPIEFVHANKKALVSQIEVGLDTPSFDHALRQALRQDPDVILIGEMRDVDTLRMALRAADTGHQVFSTVHSVNAPLTIERIIAMFPPAEHKLLLSQLSHSLEAVISQRLLPAVEGDVRLPVVEILRGGPVTEKFILEGRLDELSEYIQNGERGMQSFDQHLLDLFKQDKIAGKQALACASNPETFIMAMRGIQHFGSGRKG